MTMLMLVNSVYLCGMIIKIFNKIVSCTGFKLAKKTLNARKMSTFELPLKNNFLTIIYNLMINCNVSRSRWSFLLNKFDVIFLFKNTAGFYRGETEK